MEIFNCRLCSGGLRKVLDLGSLFISGFLTEHNHAHSPEPLVLATCEKCGFAQLKHIVEPDRMYRQYWYKSSLNPSMINALENIVQETLERWGEKDQRPYTLDIGANDGSMLAMYPERFVTIGFDPALNLADAAEKNCNFFVNDYFSAELYPCIGKADIVTAIAMFYDLNTPGDFLDEVHKVMEDDGIFVIQMTDMLSMLQANAFDNICHEHAGYYTLAQVCKLLNDHNFYVFDVEYNGVNGGSVRVYAAKKGSDYLIQPSVQYHIGRETEYLQQYEDPFLAFSIRVMNIALAVNKAMRKWQEQDIPVHALGASTKGNTLLQYFDLDKRSIMSIGEVNEDKYGRKTVGTNIPIVPEDELLATNPMILMILPWHFKTFFIEKLWDRMENGMNLFFPLPEPELVSVVNGVLHHIPLLDEEKIIPWAK